MWNWQIRTLHRREVRAWKTGQLQTFLGTTSKWKDLRKFLPRPSGQRIVAQPHEVFFVLSFISSCQLLPDPSLGQMQKKYYQYVTVTLLGLYVSTPNIL